MKYLSVYERKMIAKMRDEEGLSYRAIGRILGRSHTTISLEMRLNKLSHDGRYDPEKAHGRFERRQLRKGKRPILERRPDLKAQIIARLTEDQWSPEQIAGELNTRTGTQIISHETIYQFLYSEEGRRLKLWVHLRHKKRPSRAPRGARTSRRKDLIPDRTPVHCREEKQFGDLETDSMIFSKQKWILSVQVEVMSKRCILTKLPNKTAMETHEALRKSIVTFGENIVKSTTFDNGTENMLHTRLKEDFGIQTYFCDPYSSWQKGLVENTNKLIRQYLPRWTNMEHLSEEQLYEIQEKLNNRPRKSLRYNTPNQVYDLLTKNGRI